MYVKHRFYLSRAAERRIKETPYEFGYGEYGKYIYYSKYSRQRDDCPQEQWPDTTVRVINGLMSIRKNHYSRNMIHWDELFWQDYAERMAIAMVKMHWLPPGRGIYHLGMPFIYERGAMALYNCAFTLLGDEFANDIHWMMDALMHGVGVGGGPVRTGMEVYQPKGEMDFVIPDSREGWCDSVRRKIAAYTRPGQMYPYMIYDEIRLAGSEIKTFGGTASGPAPLMELHDKIEEFFGMFQAIERGERYDELMLKTDIGNYVGVCTVAGNVRRSAEIMVASIMDSIFLDLKNYEKYPYREGHGWMSNNTVTLLADADFDLIGEVAKRVVEKGEPGLANLRNFLKGRIGKDDGLRIDNAVGLNPCGEIPLEDKEVCNLAETCPTRCNEEELMTACDYASMYSSTVSLLPTHRPETNRVIARNRRIGVSLIGISDWRQSTGVTHMTRLLRDGYTRVRETNRWANSEAGVPEAIRVTTVKPGGTVPKMVGAPGGMSAPTFEFMLRRSNESIYSPICQYLIKAGFPHEISRQQPNSMIFEFPVYQGNSPSADKVSVWEQAALLELLQREWADNAVSNTLYFKPRWPTVATYSPEGDETTEELKNRLTLQDDERSVIAYGKVNVQRYDPAHEEHAVEPVLGFLAPSIKSLSLLPHSGEGAYDQMPESALTEEEFIRRMAELPRVDWSNLLGSDGQDEKYCTKEGCVL